MNFIITDQQDYKVEGLFNPDDFILPLNSHIQSMNSLIKLSQSKKWKEIQNKKKQEVQNMKGIKPINKNPTLTEINDNDTLAIPRISSNLNNVGSIQNFGNQCSTTPIRGGGGGMQAAGGGGPPVKKSQDYFLKVTRKESEGSEEKSNELPNNQQQTPGNTGPNQESGITGALNNMSLKPFSFKQNQTDAEQIPFTQTLASVAINEEEKSEDLSNFQLDENDYNGIMLKRWQSMLKNLAETDRNDTISESVFLNKPGPKRQQQPEFAQSVYLRIRSNEEAFAIGNYLENAEDAETQKKQGDSKKRYISEYDRSYAVQKIFDLHARKDYKVETLFTACYVMDRYLHKIGYKNYPREKICQLAVISLLMAAKLDQPIQPSFNRMINMLSDSEKKHMTKDTLVDLEFDILIELQFCFNFPGPMESVERFLRIIEYDHKKIVYDMSYQICKFALTESKFLNYRPSQIAAASVIISVNIHEKEQFIKKTSKRRNSESGNKISTNFFETDPSILYQLFNNTEEENKKAGLTKICINTKIWTNFKVINQTGFSIEMVKEALYHLAFFIQENLQPNRLEGFDIEQIKTLKDSF